MIDFSNYSFDNHQKDYIMSMRMAKTGFITMETAQKNGLLGQIKEVILQGSE